ncbi:MAG: bestrophin family ion channel, partial [Flavobacteriales bacterium]
MVSYDPSNWLKALAIHRSDTFRRLWPWLLGVMAFTYAVGFIETERLGLGSDSLLTNLPVMHSLLGFALSMLLVFRTNSAYDRWWEGRKLWGQLVNASRNLAVKILALLPDDAAARAFYAKLIPLFAHELRLHLQREKTRLELDS